MNTQISKIAFIISSLLTSSWALAETTKSAEDNNDELTDIEIVTVTGRPNLFGALKADTPLLETARSVSIETAEQFIEKGALTLDDTLTYSAGVVGETFGFSTRGDFIQVRGFDAFEYRDGMQSLSGNYNNTRPEVYTLEQVEVLKGPASVLFGPGSPGGIVNIVTKRPDVDLDNEAVFELGSFDRKQISLDVSADLSGDNSWLGRFVGIYRDSDTQIEQVQDDSIVLAPSLTYRMDDDTQFTLLFDYTKRESDSAHQFLPLSGTINPHPSGQQISNTVYLGEPGFNRFDTESFAVTFLAEHRIDDVWSLDMSSRYRDGESEYRQTWVSFTGAGNPRIDANGNGARSWYAVNGFSDQFQIDVRARANFDTGEAEHQLLIGASHQAIDNRNDLANIYGWDFSQGFPNPVGGVLNVFNPQYGFTAELPPLSRGAEAEDDILGLYIHDQISWNNWIVNMGVRFDSAESDNGSERADDNEASISASVLYQFDNGLSPYINYSESFRPVPGSVRNENGETTEQLLKPQEGEQVEVGLKYQPVGTRHFISLAWYDIELSNLPNPQALPNTFVQQLGVSSVTGVELEASANFDHWQVELNMALNDSEDPDGNQRSSIPEQQASLWTSYRPGGDLDGLTLGSGLRYVGQSESSALAANGFFTITTPSYTVMDLMASYRWDNWLAQLNVRNLGNREYYTTCLARGDCYPGEERNVVARLSYQF